MINAAKLHKELENAGIPIDGCSCEGRIDFKKEATAAQKAQAAEILFKHDPYDYQEERRKAYAPIGDQLDMLWHDIDNGLFGDSAKLSAWFSNCKNVKNTYPEK